MGSGEDNEIWGWVYSVLKLSLGFSLLLSTSITLNSVKYACTYIV